MTADNGQLSGRLCAVEDMEDFWLVGCADEKFGTGQYLMLQRSFEDDGVQIDAAVKSVCQVENSRSSFG